MTEFDVIILGAGPAGMSAARVAADHGAQVLLLDEAASPGGQIYRGILENNAQHASLLGESYIAGKEIARAIEHKNIKYCPNCVVWNVTMDAEITYSHKGKAARVKGRHVILATGALERPVPIPGWTLPGAMTAGAAQILLKAHKLVPKDAVLAGTGPLLYLIALQLIKAGAPPKALVETQTFSNKITALPFLPMALRGLDYLIEGRDMLAVIKGEGIPRYTGVEDIRLHGEDKVSAISFNHGNKRINIETETALLHAGVIPNTIISQALRLDHIWDESQACFKPVINDFGLSSNTLFSIAGDGASIGGAKAAACCGKLSAYGALKSLGFGEDSAEIWTQQHLLKKETSIRPFLERVFPVPNAFRVPADDVIICRCENVSAGDIRRFSKKGCKGPNQAKAFGRAGMGPCQGRYCGVTVTEILAKENGMNHEETGALRGRSPLKPVSLGELASLAPEGESEDPSAKLRKLTK